ncbi:hypothetical protein RND71_023542 [Anisodus tanguticus]|uniref:non-specific serine/threonine protein kinase n=1 Tax=Anisodus tanguticus TaxID=243964 RepID=A0AAE1RVQ8_9SOLA|nr:hypothetical protein RND71_023542 [Anisodus tanguticus]
MSVVVSPPPSFAPFPVPPIVLSPPPQLPSPAPASQPNATAPPVSSLPPTLPPQSAPPMASPPLPQSPPPSTVTLPPPMASPPTTSAPPPLPSSPPPSPPANSPPSESSPPPASSPPPKSSPPPASSPPPPSSPPVSSSPPPKVEPPPTSPPPQPSPPTSSPPPPPKVDAPPTSPPPQPTTPPPSSPSPSPNVDPPPVSPPPPAQNPDPSPPPQSGSSPPPPSPQNSPPPPARHHYNNSSNAADSSNSPSSSGIGTGGTVAVGVIIAVLLLSIIGVVGWCIWKRKKKAVHLNGGNVMPSSVGSTPKSDSVLLKIQESTPVSGSGTGNNLLSSPGGSGGLGNPKIWFTYEELVKVTNDFSAENVLGAGGFGSVYKGCLPDGKGVAVKQLDIGGRQGDREFRAEVEIISRVHHRHLVSLWKGRPVMDWATRVKIAVGAARGIAYLHEDCNPHIIHRDIKSSNILLDINFEARVSDFGLAKLAQDAKSHVTTRVVGTFGCMAPEYASSGKLTENPTYILLGEFWCPKAKLKAMIKIQIAVNAALLVHEEWYCFVSFSEIRESKKRMEIDLMLLDIRNTVVILLFRKFPRMFILPNRTEFHYSSPPELDVKLSESCFNLIFLSLPGSAVAYSCTWKVEFDQLAEPPLERNYVIPEMFQLIEAAAACVRHSAAKRPGLGQIMRAFDNMSMSDLTNGMKVGASTIYNSAEQSAEIRLFRRMAFGSPDFSSDFFSQGTQHSGELAEDRV